MSGIYGDRFQKADLPVLGDDIKSQVEATMIHKVLTRLFEGRGQPIKRSYQLNVGANTGFSQYAGPFAAGEQKDEQDAFGPQPDGWEGGQSSKHLWWSERLCLLVEGQQTLLFAN